MKTECDKCSKPTWKGCGKHIEQALKDVPEDERCKCPRDVPEPATATTVNKTEETKDVKEVKAEETKTTTTTDNEVKVEETKAKTD